MAVRFAEEKRSSVRFPEESLEQTKKPAWDIQSPEELVKMGFPWQAAGLISTGQQLSPPLARGANMALLGLPEKMLQARGKTIPETNVEAFGRDISRPMDAIAQTIGLVKGAPLRLGKAVAGPLTAGMKGVSMAGSALKGAASGAATLGTAMGAHTPAEEAFTDWRGRAGRAAAGAAFGGVGGAATGLLSNFSKTLQDASQLKTGEQVRGAFGGFKKNMTDTFEKALYKITLKNPGKKVDISKELTALERGVGDAKKFKTMINSSPRLKAAIQSGGKLSLKQSQDLKNQLSELASDRNWAGVGVKPSTGEVMDFVKSIQGAKHSAFPAMKRVDSWYNKMNETASLAEKFTVNAKTATGFKQMVGDPATRTAFKKILPPDLYSKVLTTAKMQNINAETLGVIGTFIKYGMLYQMMNNMLRNLKVGDSGFEIQGE